VVVYERFGARGIWYLKLDEDRSPGEPVLVIDPAGDESEPVVSPDGKWLAYSGDETGRSEIYLVRFPSGDGKWQVSTEGGGAAHWSPDGTELFYVNFDGFLVAAKIAAGPRPVLGAPEVLFGGLDFGLGGELLFSVGNQGERLLVVRNVEKGQQNPKIMLVQNWYAEFSESDGR
jgi:dipeptidyl aminopeptidase/acylaminoacyl peptidase